MIIKCFGRVIHLSISAHADIMYHIILGKRRHLSVWKSSVNSVQNQFELVAIILQAKYQFVLLFQENTNYY